VSRSARDAADGVVIDCFPEAVARYTDGFQDVVVDVIRATTLAVTAVDSGRRCLIAAGPAEAAALHRRLPDSVLAGEQAGDMPDGFEMNNSPADLVARADVERPLIMVSSSGVPLMLAAGKLERPPLVACFRNVSAVSRVLLDTPGPIALIGAGSRGEFREEDQMGCAWIADRLIEAGRVALTDETRRMVERWRGAPLTACATSNSVAYLNRAGFARDYDFIVEHDDDLDLVCEVRDDEVVDIDAGAAAKRARIAV
jgi:2-phosphosulfolactate phosphatase